MPMAGQPCGSLSAQARAGGSPPRSRWRLLDPWPLSVALIWGGNFVAYKLVLRELPPLAIVGTRFALTTPLLLMVLRLMGRCGLPARQHWRALAWAGLVVMGGQQISFMYAVNLTTASEAALTISTAPIFTALLAVALGQERLTPLNWLGVVAGFGGVALVVLGGAPAPQAASQRWAGDLLMLFSAFLYGYFMVLAKPLVERHGGLVMVTYVYCLASLVIIPVALPQLLEVAWRQVTPRAWALLVGYIVLLAGAYGFTAWYTTIGRTSAAATAVYQYLVPVVAMLSAALLLGEHPTGLQLVGATIALLGVGLARWQPALAGA
jgi:drug/metabolite transporter (DMT)-like permease